MKLKRLLVLFLCIICLCAFVACEKTNGDIGDIEADLIATLDSIRDSSSADTGFHLSANSFQQRTEMAQKIADLVTYDIKKTTRDDNEAKVTVSFSLPDAVAVMEASLSSAESVEELLEKFESELTKKKYIIQKNITLELIYIDDHWYLAPNLEVDDVFSGGLLEEYAQSNLNSFNKLLEDAE